MGKIAKVEELRERVYAATEAYDDVYESLEAARTDVEMCKKGLLDIQEAPKLKKKGNFLIILGLLLIVLEIMLVTETFITGYSDFDTVDIVIIGAVLLWGIIRKKNAMKEYRQKMQGSLSAEELKQKLAKAEADVQKYEQIKAKRDQAQEELESYISYSGKVWDLNTVRLTNREMQQLEKDLPELMLAIAYTNNYNFVYDNWFCLYCMNAIPSNDWTVRDKLGQTKSWILVVSSLAMSVFAMEVLHRHYNDDKSIDMEQALNMSQAGPPRNEDEKEYFELLKLAVPRMVYVVTEKVKSYL